MLPEMVQVSMLCSSYKDRTTLDSDPLFVTHSSSFVLPISIPVYCVRFQVVGSGPHAAALHVCKLNVINEKGPNHSE